jgi:arylsulfatase A-like enzyme
MQLRPKSKNLIAFLAFFLGAVFPAEASRRFPDIVIITVDTLRLDRVSAYGYSRPTTPNIDQLIARGIRFTEARVAEPLTAPSMSAMITSLYPHEHGTSRNGLRMRPDLPSLPGVLKRRGYVSAAFVSNWTLRDQISGLGEHFDHYQEVFTRNRWLIFFKEATGDDVTDASLEWIEDQVGASRRRPFIAWIHYTEPHAPYRFHKEFAERLGIDAQNNISKSDQYDTEVAFVDQSIGRLLKRLAKLVPSEDLIVAFASDHGESLGEHEYWGHGRHLYEPTLHIPMSLTWQGRVKPGDMRAPASLLDLTPTLLGLLDLEAPPGTFRGFNWAPVFHGDQQPPMERVTYHQAHRGAVKRSGNKSARRQGLLEVGWVKGGSKEILRVTNNHHHRYDLAKDPEELENLLAQPGSEPSPELLDWLRQVREGLDFSDLLPPPSLDDTTLEQLKALGYID